MDSKHPCVRLFTFFSSSSTQTPTIPGSSRLTPDPHTLGASFSFSSIGSSQGSLRFRHFSSIVLYRGLLHNANSFQAPCFLLLLLHARLSFCFLSWRADSFLAAVYLLFFLQSVVVVMLVVAISDLCFPGTDVNWIAIARTSSVLRGFRWLIPRSTSFNSTLHM